MAELALIRPAQGFAPATETDHEIMHNWDVFVLDQRIKESKSWQAGATWLIGYQPTDEDVEMKRPSGRRHVKGRAVFE